MKLKLLTTLILGLLFFNNIFSQGNLEFNLHVVDINNKPLKGLKVSAIETSTLKTVEEKTDEYGNLTINIDNGKDWAISVGEMKKYLYLTVTPFQMTTVKRKIVYNVDAYYRKKEQDKNRTNTNFKVVEQNYDRSFSDFNQQHSMLIIIIKNHDGVLQKDIDVSIVNVRDSVLYHSKTKRNGEVVFVLPNNTKYDIDVNGLKNYAYIDFDHRSIIHTLKLSFVPTKVDEKEVNDTIYQNVISTDKESSERALVKVLVRGGKRDGKNELVYFKQLNTNKTYVAKTNDEKFALFLLPIKHIYIVDFKYQKNVDAFNLNNASSLATGEILVYYSPDPRLEYPEKFIPTSNTLYIKNFNTFLEKQYEKPRDKPFILSIIGANNINKNSREALFMLRLSTSDVYGQSYRMPLNVSFLLDKSGSMYCCERSESLKKSLWDIGNSLTDEDVVSVVLFDNEAFTVQHSFDSHLDGFERIIENYSPNGGTNIYKGLQEGVANIIKEFDPDKSNRIILLTDGYGTSQPVDILNFVEQMSNKGVEFSTIGLGDGFNQSLLELISIKGNGTFNYVDNSVKLSDVFLEEVKKSFNYKVKNLKIEVFHNENLIFSNLYGFQTDSVGKGKLSFSISKMPSNFDYISYLKFSIDKPSPEIENEPLIIKVSYFDLIENKEVSYEEIVALKWTDETNTELLLEKEEKKLYGIAILNQSLKLMADANEANNPKAAKLYLQQAIDQINEIFPDAKPKDVKKLFDDVNKYMKLFKQIEMNKY